MDHRLPSEYVDLQKSVAAFAQDVIAPVMGDPARALLPIGHDVAFAALWRKRYGNLPAVLAAIAAKPDAVATRKASELALGGRRAAAAGYGIVGKGGAARGLLLHPVLAVEAGTGALLGLVSMQVWNRAEGVRAPRRQRETKAASKRWLSSRGATIAWRWRASYRVSCRASCPRPPGKIAAFCPP